ncbi:unnamed protein product [Malassezia sympodialis ATCC 42132]|uniref:uncharacterized protein n=1 Tax=Malassezia sympodialis (strain ATCC 42132) TaxID=1230383 RepID=UPI0002C274C4|nr:uncharacterized protein MSY001_0881 [Malassezia sympodialis ATCC 42132]CCU98175.1 unnamed protein product [Malassezia sympodialis ATCC 42132]|eukprot:XP_018739495.1 uncharacterized protein MSY001_0881 [Malassezia sympodialis ATCC 42132]
MIGVTVAALLASSCFLLGMLGMHWRADHLILWESDRTPESVLVALQYYVSTVGAAPTKYTTVLLVVGTIQATILGSKIFMGSENNWLFDGASLFLVCASGILYVNKIHPFVDALPSVMPPPQVLTSAHFQQTLGILRELASAHILLSMALIGIILLQCGKYYSRERNEEVDVRLVRRLRQLQQEERKSGQVTASSPDLLMAARGGAH